MSNVRGVWSPGHHLVTRHSRTRGEDVTVWGNLAVKVQMVKPSGWITGLYHPEVALYETL
jgi:hypothetical protein